jgi:hypothetical protein
MFYSVPDPRYAMTINLLTGPGMIDTSTTVMWDQIRALRAEGSTSEELQIAHTILTRRLENARQSNVWWTSQLVGAVARGTLDQSSWERDIPMFTVEQLRETAKMYMPENVYIQRTVKPIKKEEGVIAR